MWSEDQGSDQFGGGKPMEDKEVDKYMNDIRGYHDRMKKGGFNTDFNDTFGDGGAFPKTKRRPVDLGSLTIKVVGNGYTVTSQETGDRLFVFDDMEKLQEFIKEALSPTEEQQDFIEEV
jgi:hypothetical protein